MDTPWDDPIGRAVYDFHFNVVGEPVVIHSDDFDDDTLDPSYLFRSYKDMPPLEKKALNLCRGQILDVGAGAGAHSVYLQEKGFNVTALENSELCCEVLRSRNIRQVVQQNIFDFKSSTFDTILLLMNGTGIAGTLPGLNRLIEHLKLLLNPNGQILIDSSDLIYLYEDKGSAMIDLVSPGYYGELIFQTEYRDSRSKPFPWLYIDVDSLTQLIEKNKLKLEKVYYGQHFDYLAHIKN